MRIEIVTIKRFKNLSGEYVKIAVDSSGCNYPIKKYQHLKLNKKYIIALDDFDRVIDIEEIKR